MDTGLIDKNGIRIFTGQYAITLDREGNEWVGIIEYMKASFKEEFKVEGIFVDGVHVFKSNMIVWLFNWVRKGLEIVEGTEEIKQRYQYQKKLPWGYYYSKETKENYYKTDSLSYEDRETLRKRVGIEFASKIR